MSRDIRRPIAAMSAVALALTVTTAAPSFAQDASPSAPPAPTTEECVEPEPSLEPLAQETLSMPEDFRIALFEGVWEGVRDFYIDPDTNGLDWEAIGDEYAPLIIQTDNAYEVYEILAEMVALLDDPFTNFYAPEDLGDPETFDPTYGGIGALLDTSADEDQGEGLRLVYVFDGGSAKESGMDARDRIVGVNGDPCARIADIRGPAGTDVTLTVVSPGEAPRDLTLERRRIDPVVRPEAWRLEQDPSVGYLRVISLSGQEAIDGIEQALTRFMRDEPIEGLVIDLRASNQGAPAVMIELLRTFVDGEVGQFHLRQGTEPIEIEANDLADDYADIPVVVLIDEGSEADAEQAAAVLQDQGRATVIGQQTTGKTHGANNVDFLDGSLLQIVSVGFQMPDGEFLEGRGVTPDIEVDDDWLDYPFAEDPGLLAALEVIDEARAAATEASATEAPATEAPATEASIPSVG